MFWVGSDAVSIVQGGYLSKHKKDQCNYINI